MKYTIRLVLLLVAVIGFLSILTIPAIAQAVAAVPAAAAPAVTVPPAAAAPSFLTTILNSFSSTGILGSIVTLASVLVAIWQSKTASTKQKVAQSLVKTIEAATAIPAVQSLETKIKSMATAEATALGVQDDLHKIVTEFTSQSTPATPAAA